MFEVKIPRCCSWISNATWNTLTLKEKDFVIFVHARRYSREKIMRKLYLEDRTSFWRIKTSVKTKLENDVAKYNEHFKNTLKKTEKE